MNSPFANLFLKIQEKIKAEVPEILWIDFDLGQLEAFDGQRPPVEWPCLLIDFPDTVFRQMQGYQDGDVNIVLRLAFDEYESTNAETPTLILQSALDYLEIEQKIYEALQAWDADGLLTNDMIRQNAQSEKRNDDNFRVRRITFSATFSDNSVTG